MTALAAKQLRHVFSVTSGATPDSGKASYWDGDILWATPEDISSLSTYWLRDTRRKITQAGYDCCGTTMAPPGSIVLTKRAPIGQVAVLAEEACSNQGCFLLTPRGETDTRFFYYWISAQTARLQVLGRGSTFMELSTDELKSLKVPHPPLPRQRAIADYLDRETARLHALVAKKERVLELLAEKRRALITRAVTRGLDARDHFRDSGSPWLGEIPGHWQRTQLRRFTRFITSGSRGWADHYSDSGSLFVRIGNLTRDSTRLDLTDVQYVDPPEGSEGERTRIQPGDLLFSITAYLGSIAVAPIGLENAYVNQHIALVRLDIAKGLIPEFAGFAALSEIGQSQLEGQGYGGTKTQLALDDIREIWFPVPPMSEQRAIVSRIERDTASVDGLCFATARTIALLKERRAALIAAAVTGQIDVGRAGYYTDEAASQKEPGQRS